MLKAENSYIHTPCWSLFASGSTRIQESVLQSTRTLRGFHSLMVWSSPIATSLLQQSPGNPWHTSFFPNSGLSIRSPMLSTLSVIRWPQKAAPEEEIEFFSCCTWLSPGGWFLETPYIFKEISLNQKTRFHSCHLNFLSKLFIQKPSKLLSIQEFSQTYFRAKRTENCSPIASLN